MHRKLRRYEVLFPIQFNDGRDVPNEWRGEATLELLQKFGAASCETQIIQGVWTHENTVYRDNLVRYIVDVPDTDSNRRWMKGFKQRWKVKLDQLEIWLISFPILVE